MFPLAGICFTLLFLLLPSSLRGQAFERIDLSIEGGFQTNRGAIGRSWRPTPAGGFRAATPVPLGWGEIGGLLQGYQPRTDAVPAYTALALFAGWGLRLNPRGPFSIIATGRIGNYRMVFDDDTFSGVRNESELLLGGHLEILGHLSESLAVQVSGSHTKIFTFHRITLTHLSLGIRYSFQTPPWLKAWLQ